MARRRLKRPNIDPANFPLCDRYDSDHPAIVALFVHSEARDVCVGREIACSDLRNKPIDQSWNSRATCRRWTFSGFAYMYISFNLVMDSWLTNPNKVTDSERVDLTKLVPEMLQLLDECQERAEAEFNWDVLPLITKAREFVESYRDAILFRHAQLKS